MNRKKIFEDATQDICHLFRPGFVEWLEGQGFFTLPASLKYHGCTEGGLFDHSLNVAESLITLTTRNELSWSRPESPVIVGLFHDLCKLDEYVQEIDEPGREMMGTREVVGRTYTWERKPATDRIYTGHGDKSVLMLAPWISLTPEEVACIRWHMGAFDDKENWPHFTNAIHEFPNVLWTHQADMIAAHLLEVLNNG